jgi:general secretion pathway protein J
MTQRGLTLVEMLISLTIFSAVAATSVAVLRLGVDSDAQLQDVSDRVSQFQVARSLLKSDLAQVVPRVVRDVDGNNLPGPMVGGNYIRGSARTNDAGEELLIAMVRNGRDNPQALYPRSTLQYVEYLVSENQLLRRSTAYTDVQTNTPVSTRVLLGNVEDVSVRFLDGRTWRTQWQSRPQDIAPDAVEMTLTHPVYGELVQLFHVGRLEG